MDTMTEYGIKADYKHDYSESGKYQPRHASIFAERGDANGVIGDQDPFWIVSGPSGDAATDGFVKIGIADGSGSWPDIGTAAYIKLENGKVTANPGIVLNPTTTTLAPDTKGSLMYDTGTDELKYFDGSWQIVSAGGLSAHVLDSETYHTATGLTVGWVISADSATTFSWKAPAGGTDDDAIHDNVANEITAITPKTTLGSTDEFVLEDGGASFVKKAVTFANIESSISLANLGTRTHASLSDAPADAHHVAFVLSDFTTAFAAESLANLTTRAHSDLSDAPTDAHHTKYTNAEAIAAVVAENPLTLTNDLVVSGGNIAIGTTILASRPVNVLSSYSATTTMWMFQDSDATYGAMLQIASANDECVHRITGASQGWDIGLKNFNSDGTSFQWVNMTASPDELSMWLSSSGALTLKDALTIGSITAGVSDYDKFLVSDGGLLKFRTGSEVATDIGAATVPLALTDLASYVQGSIIIGGGADWEALGAGTEDYVLKMGAAEPAWGQIDYSELTGSAGHWDATDTEGVITAELVDGQSIDLAIDGLISTHAGDDDAHHALVTVAAYPLALTGQQVAFRYDVNFFKLVANSLVVGTDDPATDDILTWDGTDAVWGPSAGGMSAHDLTGAYHTEDATGGAGNVLRASGATAFAWATLAHGDLSDAPSSAHHVRYADSEAKAACVSDVVFGSGWNAVTDVAPSKNAVYDEMETRQDENQYEYLLSVPTRRDGVAPMTDLRANNGYFFVVGTGWKYWGFPLNLREGTIDELVVRVYGLANDTGCYAMFYYYDDASGGQIGAAYNDSIGQASTWVSLVFTADHVVPAGTSTRAYWLMLKTMGDDGENFRVQSMRVKYKS